MVLLPESATNLFGLELVNLCEYFILSGQKKLNSSVLDVFANGRVLDTSYGNNALMLEMGKSPLFKSFIN